jgi:hypothetical protein
MAAIPVISGLLMVAVVLLLPYAQLGGGGGASRGSDLGEVLEALVGRVGVRERGHL